MRTLEGLRRAAGDYVSGAAQGFDGVPAPMPVRSTEDALAFDIRRISEDVTRALRQVATGELPRFHEQEH